MARVGPFACYFKTNEAYKRSQVESIGEFDWSYRYEVLVDINANEGGHHQAKNN